MSAAHENQTQPAITDELIEEHGLSKEEYTRVLNILGREPNIVELGIFSVMWSEHCSYKTTRIHLKTLPTKADWVICGPGENAGIIDIGDDDAIIFKMESHNHPSFIEPYQGAATGVGGIMRDVFTMGARPIAMLNALRFGEPEHEKTKHLINGVVAGIGGYGNCMGIPTVGGECNFHKAYNTNILVNAMCVGLAHKDKIFYSAASAIGSPVIYVGAKTGRDGIHGATMASAEFDENSEEKRPTVQVGAPFTEKRVMEACLELMATDAIIAIQDMGAAGLTCSSLEMADKGNAGIELNLNHVPTRELGMTPYEMMLSESQERMLMVIKPEKQDQAKAIFDKWEIDFAPIGTITDTGRMVLTFDDKIVADMPVKPLSDEAPIYDRPHTLVIAQDTISYSNIDQPEDVNQALITLLSTPDLGSKRWIFEQYDRHVMNDTLRASGSDASLVRVHGTNKAVAMTSDCTPRYCVAHPVEGGKQAVAESYRNICATGATPLAITNCLNFANPEKPEIMGQLVGCLNGMKEACQVLDYPVVSGNVSLYNETSGQSILPTPSIGGVGLLHDYNKVISGAFVEANQTIIIIGDTTGHLGASMYLTAVENREEGLPPTVDLSQEKKHGEFIRSLIDNNHITACHDISDGGLYVAIAEMAIASQIGASLNLEPNIPLFAYLFGEDQARYIITATPEEIDTIEALAKKSEIPLTIAGTTGGDVLSVNANAIELAKISEAYDNALEKVV